jgi:hypothetical protein
MALHWVTLVWKMEVTLYLLLWTFWMREAVRFVVIHIIFIIWGNSVPLYIWRAMDIIDQVSVRLIFKPLPGPL